MKYKNIRNRKNIFSILVLLLLLVGVGIYVLHIHSTPVLTIGIDDDTDENVPDSKALMANVADAVTAPKVTYHVSSSTPQFVLFSFDGSKSVDMLNETLDFERTMASKGKSLHFTYFINAVYFITKDNAHLYQAPGQNPGISKISFSSTTPEILLRVQAFNKAFTLGNEIGSHTAGHFNGSTWSYDYWSREFTSFATLMRNVQQNNLSEQIETPLFLNAMKGFRAPYLGVDDNLYKVLGEFHFTYDTSGVSKMDVWPSKDIYGVWRIPLAMVPFGPEQRPVIAMDYNFFKKQSNAKEQVTKLTTAWNTYFDQIFTAYTAYFNTDYQGNRAPIIIAGHFSKWNDGVYWEAMKAFADSVCGRPQVKCVTYKELVDYLNTTGVPPIIN
jgi:hypothetical protein